MYFETVDSYKCDIPKLTSFGRGSINTVSSSYILD